jgi:hypothetical protein
MFDVQVGKRPDLVGEKELLENNPSSVGLTTTMCVFPFDAHFANAHRWLLSNAC